MKDTIFDSPEKIQAGIDNFTTLLTHPGWQLLESIVNVNIQILTDNILNGGDKEQMDRLRDKLEAHKNIINTPRDQIKKLKGSESPVPEPDPYDKPKKKEEED